MTSHYTSGSVTTLHDFGGVLGWTLDTFFFSSHNFIVMALGSCVKWPLFCKMGKVGHDEYNLIKVCFHLEV